MATTKNLTFLMLFFYSVLVLIGSAENLPTLKEAPPREISIRGSLRKTTFPKSKSDEAEAASRRKREFRSFFYKNFSPPGNFRFLKNPYEPHRSNFRLSSSWGGEGMPFNALYVPNVHQRKMLKSLPKMSEPLPRTNSPQGINKEVPEVLDFVLQSTKSSKLKMEERLYKKPFSRKYYSSIPHFYVSYGW